MDAVKAALVKYGGNEERAINYLLDGESSDPMVIDDDDGGDGDDGSFKQKDSIPSTLTGVPLRIPPSLTKLNAPAKNGVTSIAQPPSLSSLGNSGLKLSGISSGGAPSLSMLSQVGSLRNNPIRAANANTVPTLSGLSQIAGVGKPSLTGRPIGSTPLSGFGKSATPSSIRARGWEGWSRTKPLAGVGAAQPQLIPKSSQSTHRKQISASISPPSSSSLSNYGDSSQSSVFAAPSDFASFWASSNSPHSLDSSLRALLNNNPLLSNLLEPAAVGAGFDFSTPSPDDKVLAARTGTNTPAASTLTSASSTRSTSPTRTHPPSQHAAASVSIGGAKTAASSKAKKINVLEEYEKRNSEKSSLNLVIVGHVDAGKSTLMGHLLYLLGAVTERTMQKYEREAEKMKKGSFCFAWVLDETEEERSRGSHRFTILDAPGHRDFIPNMISGASQADVALLVIDSGTGEFEHALLVRSLGVSQLVVAVNKLDTMDWAEHRFLEIKEKLMHFLMVFFVPCSGFTGENMLLRKSEVLSSWYKGSTLQECLDALTPPVRALEKPFRLPVVDYFKGGVAAGGGGSLSVSGRHGVVKSIEANDDPIKWAVAGDNIVVTLNGIDVQQHRNVLCSPQALVPVADIFRCKIVTFDIAIPLTLGVPIVVHHQSASTSAIISKLISILDKATGEVSKKNPRALPKNVTAVVDITVDRPICVELAKDSRELGRVMIRSGSTVVAAGIVTEIVNRVK
ncbi:hypothetical protein BDR26DRAFT_865422 [Obelidium mucronatum]|nr:hypothetical protein BDR26DRAFT_865422 [Obelidium mucronatum]